MYICINNKLWKNYTTIKKSEKYAYKISMNTTRDLKFDKNTFCGCLTVAKWLLTL